MWNRDCLPFWSTCIHTRYLVGSVLLDLLFSVKSFVDIWMSFCLSFFWPLHCLSFFWPLHCLSFELQLLIYPVVSSSFFFICIEENSTQMFFSKCIRIIVLTRQHHNPVLATVYSLICVFLPFT
jgi:hypothetical protein